MLHARIPRQTLNHSFLAPQEQYLELSTSIPPDSTFFGMGEHASSRGLPLTREGVPITMWNRDRPSRYPDENLYGSHPHLLELRPGMLFIQEI